MLLLHASMRMGHRLSCAQLKVGASATEADLLSFAQKHITERAALPKAIRIIPVMPLTGVGKIFKPELKHLEVESALR